VLIGLFGLVNAFPIPLIDSILSTHSRQHKQAKYLGSTLPYLSILNAIDPAISGLLVTTFGNAMFFWVACALTVMIAAFAITLKSKEAPAAGNHS